LRITRDNLSSFLILLDFQESTGLLNSPDFKTVTNASFDAVLTFNPWGFLLAEQQEK
jgi:hypothetical protein